MRTRQVPKIHATVNDQWIVSKGAKLDFGSLTASPEQGQRSEEGSRISQPRTKSMARLILVASIYLMSVARADASGLYTVTYVGNSNVVQQDSAKVYNNQSGVSYAFATTTTPFTQADSHNLPETTVHQGASNPQPITYPMNVTSFNSSGTVIGSLPSGQARSDPWESVTLGYSVRSPDGQYSPFVTLVPPDPQVSQPSPGQLFLSQSNQILINAPQSMRLLDLKSGVTTPIDQLIPPDLLKGLTNGYRVQGIDDRGDIVAIAPTSEFSGRFEFSEFLLTPPGLAAPISTPEPSTLLIFGLIAGTLGARAVGLRRRWPRIVARAAAPCFLPRHLAAIVRVACSW